MHQRDRSPFLSALLQSATRLGLSDRHVLIGVSGGADSVALLRGLDSLKHGLAIQPVVCHVDHCWRGSESEADAAWVAELAKQLSVPARIERLAMTPGNEEAAREARHRTFLEVARRENCSHVALAHTADDQVETAIHRFVRGTGLRGLAGIPESRSMGEGVTLLRPLLGTFRVEIEAWLESIGQSWRTDSTNRDIAFTRNRLRHELIPLLRNEYNSQVDHAILRLATQAGEISDWLSSQADDLQLQALIERRAGLLILKKPPLLASHRLVVREFFINLWHLQGWPLQDMTAAIWSKTFDQLDTTGVGPMLPGAIRVETTEATLVFRRIKPDSPNS